MVDLGQKSEKRSCEPLTTLRVIDLVTPLPPFVKFKFHLLKNLVRSIVIMLLCSVNLNDFYDIGSI